MHPVVTYKKVPVPIRSADTVSVTSKALINNNNDASDNVGQSQETDANNMSIDSHTSGANATASEPQAVTDKDEKDAKCMEEVQGK